MLKKIFAISTLLLVLAVGALFVYNFLFKKSEPKTENTTPSSEEGKTNTAASQKASEKTGSGSSVLAVSDEAVFGASLSSDQKFVYYFLASNGQLNQADFSGKLEKVISTETFSNLINILWNKPKNKAIVKTEPAPGKSKFFYLNLAEKKVIPLKDNLDSVAWSNLGDKIIYKYFDPATKKRTVSISDPDGKNWRDISEFDHQAVEISAIPGSGDISFWPSANAYTETELVRIGFNGEDGQKLLAGKYGADFLWSTDGTRLIASCSDEKGGHKILSYLMNKGGGQLQSLLFPTFSSKCAWSKDSKTLFCALPGDIPDSAILPNDWLEGKIKTVDTFWKIDITTGKKERLVDPENITGTYDVLRPFLSQDEKTLFFVNKSDGKLYKLNF